MMKLYLFISIIYISLFSIVNSHRVKSREQNISQNNPRLIGPFTTQVGNYTVTANFGTPGFPSLQDAANAVTALVNALLLKITPLFSLQGLLSGLGNLGSFNFANKFSGNATTTNKFAALFSNPFSNLFGTQKFGNIFGGQQVNPIPGRRSFDGLMTMMEEFALVFLKAIERYAELQRESKL